MRPIQLSLTMAAANRDGICEAQTTAAAGVLTIDGALDADTDGVASMDVPRHVSIYSAADLSRINFTVTGTDRHGDTVSETIVGPTTGATVKGGVNFLSVTQVAVDDTVGTDVEVGSADEMESAWIRFGRDQGGITFDVNLSTGADMTYSVEWTAEDVENNAEHSVNSHDYVNLSALTATDNGYSEDAVEAARIAISSFVSGTVTANIIQGLRK